MHKTEKNYNFDLFSFKNSAYGVQIINP